MSGGAQGEEQAGADSEALAELDGFPSAITDGAQRPARRETQPLFLQDYWQRFTASDAPARVRATQDAGARSEEIGLVDLDSVESLESVDLLEPPVPKEDGGRRNPADSALISLGDLENPLDEEGAEAGGPGGADSARVSSDLIRVIGPPDEEAKRVEHTTDPGAEGEGGDGDDARATGEFVAMLVAEPPSEREEALARMSGDGMLDPRFAEALRKAGGSEEEIEGADGNRSDDEGGRASVAYEETALRDPPSAPAGAGSDSAPASEEAERSAVESLEATGIRESSPGGKTAVGELDSDLEATGIRESSPGGETAAGEPDSDLEATGIRESSPGGETSPGAEPARSVDMAPEEPKTFEALEDLDVKSTAQFSGLVFQDDNDTSVWDFSNTSIRRREDGDGDAGAVTIAGRYRLEEDVGSGGMARIFRVRHLNLGKEFALKIIHDDLSEDAQMRKSFIREARVASLLDHPNIVQITDFGVDDQHGAFIVMEYLRGETLHERLLRERRLRPSLALDIALQTAEALHYMHQQNIIHCDIKAENIFLSRPPREGRRRVVVKLIDFGLSRREALGAQLASSEVGGTPHFMSPEQIRGLAPQPSMDIYSLGILLYEMLVGQLPFDGELNQILSAQLHEDPIPPSKRLDEPLDESVDQLILKALRKAPAERQPSMGQMVFEIRTVMEMLGFRTRRPMADRRRHSVQELDDVEERLSVFQNSPVPLFRVDTEPKVLVANEAFQRFVAGNQGESVVGKPLDTTRLGRFYPNLRVDILAAAVDREPIQRVLTFRKSETEFVSVLIWLVPEVEERTGSTTFVGVIVPSGNGAAST